MTMHVDQLVGALVTDSDGLAVGTVEQVFRDDVDGTPSWARIRSAKGLHFVPLTGSKVTSGGGLCVPFDSRKILGEPRIRVDRHMSVEQEEQLRRYYGIRVPRQPTRREAPRVREAGDVQEETSGRQGVAAQATGQSRAGEARAGEARAGEARAGEAHAEHDDAGSQWIVRSEERIAVNLEVCESGHITVRKYVEAEPVQKTVRVFHEELDIERVPIGDDDQITGELTESEQEITLHESRAKFIKESVPVERVRVSVRKVEEDRTVSAELRKERIEVIDDGSASSPPQR